MSCWQMVGEDEGRFEDAEAEEGTEEAEGEHEQPRQ